MRKWWWTIGWGTLLSDKTKEMKICIVHVWNPEPSASVNFERQRHIPEPAEITHLQLWIESSGPWISHKILWFWCVPFQCKWSVFWGNPRNFSTGIDYSGFDRQSLEKFQRQFSIFPLRTHLSTSLPPRNYGGNSAGVQDQLRKV